MQFWPLEQGYFITQILKLVFLLWNSVYFNDLRHVDFTYSFLVTQKNSGV